MSLVIFYLFKKNVNFVVPMPTRIAKAVKCGGGLDVTYTTINHNVHASRKFLFKSTNVMG